MPLPALRRLLHIWRRYPEGSCRSLNGKTRRSGPARRRIQYSLKSDPMKDVVPKDVGLQPVNDESAWANPNESKRAERPPPLILEAETAADLMTPNVVSIAATASIQDAAA